MKVPKMHASETRLAKDIGESRQSRFTNNRFRIRILYFLEPGGMSRSVRNHPSDMRFNVKASVLEFWPRKVLSIESVQGSLTIANCVLKCNLQLGLNVELNDQREECFDCLPSDPV